MDQHTDIHWGEMQHGAVAPMSPAPAPSAPVFVAPMAEASRNVLPQQSPSPKISPLRSKKSFQFFQSLGERKVVALIVTIIIVIAGVALYIHWSNHPPALDTSTPAVPLTDAAVITAVGQLFLLPQGITPTVANVANLDQVKNDPFFAQAEPGDKVLIYPTLDSALLYSPSRNKIIAFTTIDFPTATSTASSTSPATSSPSTSSTFSAPPAVISQ